MFAAVATSQNWKKNIERHVIGKHLVSRQSQKQKRPICTPEPGKRTNIE
jgi:hypothetical protein